LTYGRPNRPPRPWLGLYAAEVEDAIVVAGLSERGPASKTGLKPGDRILAVRDEPISSLASLWRRVWASGPAGSEVVLQVVRDKETMRVRINSTNRTRLLKAPKLHRQMAVALDTLEISKRLKSAGFDDAQAEALVGV